MTRPTDFYRPRALTLSGIRMLPVPGAGARLIRDTKSPGLAVRITPAGVRSFVVSYMFIGTEKRMTIGPVSMQDGDSGLTVTAARKRAGDIRSDARKGKDPLGERQRQARAETFKQLWEQFVEQHGPRLRPATLRDYSSLARLYLLPALGPRKVEVITYPEVAALHRKVTRAGSTYQANRCVAVTRKLFSFAIRAGLIEKNPATGIELNPEAGRERYLTGEEMARLFQAMREYEKGRPSRRTYCDAVRLLLLTGARRGEVMNARWEQFDLQGGVWTKPAATTKQKRLHRVPLSGAALALLQTLPADGAWLFPSSRGKGPITDMKKPWETVRGMAGLDDVRLHDLRHCFASHAISAGVPLAVVGALLGHSQAATTQRYAHLLDDPQRKAADKVGAVVRHAETGQTGDVVPLRRGA